MLAAAVVTSREVTAVAANLVPMGAAVGRNPAATAAAHRVSVENVLRPGMPIAMSAQSVVMSARIDPNVWIGPNASRSDRLLKMRLPPAQTTRLSSPLPQVQPAMLKRKRQMANTGAVVAVAVAAATAASAATGIAHKTADRRRVRLSRLCRRKSPCLNMK